MYINVWHVFSTCSDEDDRISFIVNGVSSYCERCIVTEICHNYLVEFAYTLVSLDFFSRTTFRKKRPMNVCCECSVLCFIRLGSGKIFYDVVFTILAQMSSNCSAVIVSFYFLHYCFFSLSSDLHAVYSNL